MPQAASSNATKPQDEAGKPHATARKAGSLALMLGALGVVFGDIGTSPLYAMQAVFTTDHGAVRPNPVDVYGVISLVFWTITMVVSVKYVFFVMQADDRGEGGIMALTGLLHDIRAKRPGVIVALVMMGIIGASLFFGDGAITPAISVLSAVEGLEVVDKSLVPMVLPISIVVLVGLFAIQRFGTSLVGRLFGPVMAVWFLAIGVIGAAEVAAHPAIIKGLSPAYGVEFFLHRGAIAYFALAAVVLVVTGAEALYADMGHFGRGPISRIWFLLVFPALTLNYLAQGSLILRHPADRNNPFYLLLPAWAQAPMVVLATAATVIASQAVISGTYSVTQQAVQLGFLPRLTIRHTSEREIGQIYAPVVNLLLFVSVLAIIVGFGSSGKLASAYGLAVTGTFILTTILFLAVARMLWHRHRWQIAVGIAVMLTIDVAYFTANLRKIPDGGWLPISLALVIFTLLSTWSRGRKIVTANRARKEGALRDFIEEISATDFPVRHVPGVAVFLNPDLKATPLALRANVEHNHVLHDDVVIASVRIERVPHVPASERVRAEPKLAYSGATGDPLPPYAEHITPLCLRFGFRDVTDVHAALRLAAEQGYITGVSDVERATYFLSRITIMPSRRRGLAIWRKRIFIALARNAANPADYFHLPESQTVTLSGSVSV